MYEKCLRWIDDNLDFFDPRVNRKYAKDLLRIKSFTELLFLENMSVSYTHLTLPTIA